MASDTRVEVISLAVIAKYASSRQRDALLATCEFGAMTLIVDTGVLLAAIDADDAEHRVSVAVLDENIGQFVVPAPVID